MERIWRRSSLEGKRFSSAAERETALATKTKAKAEEAAQRTYVSMSNRISRSGFKLVHLRGPFMDTQEQSEIQPQPGLWAAVREALRGSHQDFTVGNLNRSILLLAIP